MERFQPHMRLPFENEIFQTLYDLAEILQGNVCTHLPLRKQVSTTLVNKWQRKNPNVPTAS